MTTFDYRSESLCQQTLLVMQAYSVRAAAEKVAAEESNEGWLERIDSLPQFNAEELTRVHGQLIAMGYLKFEVSGRNVGLLYQISDRGRTAMEKTFAAAGSPRADSQTAHEFVDISASDASPETTARAA